jgi:uncharacterized protein (TIGR03083 family)
MEAKELFFEERDSIVQTLRSLTPEQWDAPSLCDGWRVRDVAGHMITGVEMSLPTVLVKTARAGFNINKASARAGKEAGSRPTDELTTALASTTELSGFAKVLGYAKLVPDITIHHEDIRRAVGLTPHEVPAERMKFSLSTLRKDTGPLKAKKRTSGLRFVATDLDWAEGEGPEVRGPALSLLLAMGGRPVAIDECEGDGVAVLRTR